jgi:hypothetical protein
VGVNGCVVTKSARVLASIAAILLDTSRERGSIILTSFFCNFFQQWKKVKERKEITPTSLFISRYNQAKA